MVLFPRKGVGKFQTSRFLKWKWWKVGGGNPCYRKQPIYRCFAFEEWWFSIVTFKYETLADSNKPLALAGQLVSATTVPLQWCLVFWTCFWLNHIWVRSSSGISRYLKKPQDPDRHLQLNKHVKNSTLCSPRHCPNVPSTIGTASHVFFTRWMVSRWRVPAMKWISQRWAMSLGRFEIFQALLR